MLDLNWPRIEHVVLGAKDGPDKYLCFNPNFLGRLSSEEDRERSDSPGVPYNVKIAIVSDLADLNQEAAPTRRVLPSISSGLDME